MTRAIDRLLVVGRDRPEKREDSTPIGWVLSRLAAYDDLETAADGPVELERGGARLLVRLDRFTPAAEPRPRPPPSRSRPRTASCCSSTSSRSPRPRRPSRSCPRSCRRRCRRSTASAGSRSARSPSTSAARTATSPSASRGCGELRAGHASGRRRSARDRDRRRRAPAARGGRPGRPARARPRAGSRLVPDRHRRGARADPRLRRVVLRVRPGARLAELPGAAPSSRSRSSTTASCSAAGST